MIIRIHSRTLFAIAYGILQNREEAEDTVQDAFVKAWKSRWRVRDPEKFPAWLSTVARNRARDVFRKKRPSPFSEGLVGLAESAAIDARTDLDLDQQLQLSLAALPELHRTALTLRYFEQLDYRSIEKLLGLSNGALSRNPGSRVGDPSQRTQPYPGFIRINYGHYS